MRMFSSVLLSILALLGIVFIVYLVGVYLWEDQLSMRTQHLFGVDSDSFLHALRALTGSSLVEGSACAFQADGATFYPSMLEAITTARSTVHFETYLFQPGAVAEEFADAFVAACARGVAVRIILDAVGSLSEYHPLVVRLRDAGADVRYYHPVRWFTLHTLENRTHRKLLVVDGAVGYIGGAGVSDVWRGSAREPAWRDLMVRCTGPIVQQLQSAFLEHWIELTGDVLAGKESFPVLPRTGDVTAQVITSSPRAGSTTIRLLYAIAVASATKTIDIASAYFIPDASSLRALRRAVKRGVRVRILVPGPVHDVPVARAITRASYGKLLRRGVDVYEYQPGMLHTKLMVIDETWVTVGSANFDNRSFALNDEVNLAISDAALAQHAARAFEDDLRAALPLSLEAWNRRSLRLRIQEFFAVMIRRQF